VSRLGVSLNSFLCLVANRTSDNHAQASLSQPLGNLLVHFPLSCVSAWSWWGPRPLHISSHGEGLSDGLLHSSPLACKGVDGGLREEEEFELRKVPAHPTPV
jgi:hypothetical protein